MPNLDRMHQGHNITGDETMDFGDGFFTWSGGLSRFAAIGAGDAQQDCREDMEE